MISPRFSTLLIIVAAAATIAPSQGCPYMRARSLQKMGNGNGNGGGSGGGHGGEEQDNDTYVQELLDNHFKVDREVIHNNDGSITAKTFSEDAQVASWLQAHVAEMKARVDGNMYVRSWDPFFVSLVDHHDETSVELSNLSNGVQVELSASTDCGQSLIEAHTAVVSLFVETGRDESSKAHDVPATCKVASGVSPTTPAPSAASSGTSPTPAPSVSPGTFSTSPGPSASSGNTTTLAPSAASSGTSPIPAPSASYSPETSSTSPAPSASSGNTTTLAPSTTSGASPTPAPSASSGASTTQAEGASAGGKGNSTEISSAASHGTLTVMLLSSLMVML
ncbi:MAG: hypothetical protein SGBAC_009245 [Bacillariaceae sp.]